MCRPTRWLGAILSLTAEEAKRAGYADAIEPTLASALRFAGLDRLPLRTAHYTFAEQVARFATSPAISGLLLMVGFMGIMIEMLTLRGRIAGSIGVGSLALFFGTHLYSGFSNSLVIVLAILGIAGILLELHVIPGHFVAGASEQSRSWWRWCSPSATGSWQVAVQSLAVAAALSALMIGLSWRILPRSAFARRLVFKPAQGPEYVTSADYSDSSIIPVTRRPICVRPAWRPSMVSGSTSSRRATSFKRGPRFASAVSKAPASSCVLSPPWRSEERPMTAIGFFSALVIVAVVVGFLAFLVLLCGGDVRIRTIAAGVPLSMVPAIVRMRLMGIQPSVIVTNLVRARKAGLPLTVDEMQSHYLAGGRVEKVTLAMIAAQRAQIPLEWRRAAAIDLAGLTCSRRSRRALIPGHPDDAGLPGRREERHPAQGQGPRHGAHQHRPARRRRHRGDDHRPRRRGHRQRHRLGHDTRRCSRIPTDLKPCWAKAWMRRRRSRSSRSTSPTSTWATTSAPAAGRPGRGRHARRAGQGGGATRRRRRAGRGLAQENRAKVVPAEAEIPQAIAEAFRSGKLGVMDYYRLRNIQADTEMRGAIGPGVGARAAASVAGIDAAGACRAEVELTVADFPWAPRRLAPAPTPDPPAPPVTPVTVSRTSLLTGLRGGPALLAELIAHEVLGPPLALRSLRVAARRPTFCSGMMGPASARSLSAGAARRAGRDRVPASPGSPGRSRGGNWTGATAPSRNSCSSGEPEHHGRRRGSWRCG